MDAEADKGGLIEPSVGDGDVPGSSPGPVPVEEADDDVGRERVPRRFALPRRRESDIVPRRRSCAFELE